MNYKFINIEQSPCSKYSWDKLITLETDPNWIQRKIFKMEPQTVQFEGSGTVWKHYPSGKRASTSKEWMLVEFVEWARMNKRGDYYGEKL